MRSRHRRGEFLAILTALALLALVGGPARAATAQRINFPDLWNMSIGEYQYIEATADSGLPVTITVDTPDVCSYEASYLTARKAGLCQVTATQAGNEDWDPAVPAVRSVVVQKVASVTAAVKPDLVYEPDEVIALEADVLGFRAPEGSPIPTGRVLIRISPFDGEQVWDFDVPLDAEGTAHLDFNTPAIPLERGSYAALFSYLGDDYYAPSYTELPAMFDVANKTETILTVTPKTAPWGEEFTFKAKVVDAKTGEVPDDLTGTLDFIWPGGAVTSDLDNGIAELSTTEMAPGVNPVVAQYMDSEHVYKWGTSFDKTTVKATGIDPYLGYADGTGAVGVEMSPMYPITRGYIEPAFASEDLPAGLNIDTETGVISGTPAKTGTSTVTVTVEDAYEQFGEASFTIEIVKSEVKPKITYPTAKLRAGETMTALLPQITGLSDPLSVTAADLPPGLVIDATTGVITGTPAKVGTFAPTVTVKARQGTATTRLSIEVSAQPLPASLSYPDARGVAGSPLVPVTPYTSGLTGALVFTAKRLPNGLDVATATGTLSGTPAAAGTTTPTASVKGTGGSATTTFTVKVSKTPLPKRLSYAKVKGQQGQKITPAVPHVSGLTGTVKYTVKGLPKGLRLRAGTGVISGAPKVSGKQVATVTAKGSNGYLTAKVTMRFAKNPERPPVPLTVKGARGAGARLTAQKSSTLVTGITSKGKIQTRVECRLVSGGDQPTLCSDTVSKKSMKVTVTPTCSTPAVRVTLRVSAHPTKKQSGTYNPDTWTRTWKVAGSPSVGCLPTLN